MRQLAGGGAAGPPGQRPARSAYAPVTARRSVARASRRVESSVGSGEFELFMISGVSVQRG